MARFFLVGSYVVVGILILVVGTGLVWFRLALGFFVFGHAIVHTVSGGSAQHPSGAWRARAAWTLYLAGGAVGIVGAFSYLALPFAVIVTLLLAVWCSIWCWALWH